MEYGGGGLRSLDMLMLMADAAAAAVNEAAPSAETTLQGEEAELTTLRRRLKDTEGSELAALQAKGAVEMELAATQKELTACLDRASSRADEGTLLAELAAAKLAAATAPTSPSSRSCSTSCSSSPAACGSNSEEV